MRRRRRSSFRFIVSFLVLFSAFFAATTGHVFTAQAAPGAVAFGAAPAGSGVTNVAFAVDAADPTRVGGVSFDLSAPARTAEATIGDATTECVVSGGHATCEFPSAPRLASASSLEVTVR